MQEYLDIYGYWAILLFTFLEGETIVILAGIAAYQGLMNPFLVGLAGFTGSFLGDQLYFTIGRHYGTPLLKRWPHLQPKIEWAFRLVREYQTLYILSFRFIYGVRNVSPFVIAMSGVSRLRFVSLNLIAAALWATTFSGGGYFFGHALETLVGEHQKTVLLGLVALAVTIGGILFIRRHFRQRREKAEALAKMTSTAFDADPAMAPTPVAQPAPPARQAAEGASAD